MLSNSPYIPDAASQLSGLALDALPEANKLSPETAKQYCRHLATHHYENFTVVSWFLPSALRSHFYHIYAYCRWSDDLADETGDPDVALALLDWWDGELQACYDGNPRHPVFVALRETITEFQIPITPFRNLLVAFRQDQRVTQYETYDDLVDYCTFSANPVGHLILYLCGYCDSERQKLSDATCTALQLANFWQDISIDLAKNRIYLPLSDIREFGYSERELREGAFTANFAALMRFEVDRARSLFETGLKLCPMVPSQVRADIDLFNRGGMAILDLIERQNYNVLGHRPALSKGRKATLMLRYALKRLLA
ncbi:MAG: squalene synthase HpnC [Candidatus Latescibacteria bacterium]|jgi:squalene synthase HpnC|nr:squalene synthase HpnC [Candidatus Latescibacterota bacterium]